MKYLMGVFGVTLAFVFATAIAENPASIRNAKAIADWNDVGSRSATVQKEARPDAIRRNEYR